MLSRRRDIRGGRSKFTLVHIVDLHGLSQHGDALGPRGPCEVGVSKEFIVVRHPSQVVTIGITVTLGEHSLSISGIKNSVGTGTTRFFFDVIVGGVKRLATINPPSVIPVEAVVSRGHRSAGARKVIAPAQQR